MDELQVGGIVVGMGFILVIFLYWLENKVRKWETKKEAEFIK